MTPESVTREVDIDAAAEAVWSAVTDPDLRSAWLDDDDATERSVRVDEVDAGRRLVWTWWRPDDEPGASTVEIALRPLDGGGTRVVVTETLAMPLPMAKAQAGASASLKWDRRLLGLELMFVGVLAGVR